LHAKYEVKTASDGHAGQHCVIPRGLAIAATPENLRRFETEKQEYDGERKVHEASFGWKSQGARGCYFDYFR